MEMLFVRDFTGFTGGHLKFFDYLNHTVASGAVNPVLYLTPRSRAVSGNIFKNYGGATIDEVQKSPSYFVAGEDWFILDDAGVDPGNTPVVNLIQGFRHSDPGSALFACLARPALRICVSPNVANAIRDQANGDVVVIENGVEVDLLSATRPLEGPARVLIAGTKNRAIAQDVAVRLAGDFEVDLILDPLPRDIFLARMAEASICIVLPFAAEGYFLPALEAMALGRAVIVPDCKGNLCYCEPGINCLMPDYSADALATAARVLLRDAAKLNRIAKGGLNTARVRSLEKERASYHSVLARYLRISS
jgi:hypothetical protein